MPAKTSPTKPALTLKVNGPRPGRIRVAELVLLASHAQTAVNRQAEVLEGRSQTLRPGPPIGKVRAQCELELISLRRGSTRLGFGLAAAQATFHPMLTMSADAIAAVGEAIERSGRGDFQGIDVGVLDSIRNLGTVLGPRVKSLEWIAPGTGRGKQRRQPIAAVLDRKVQRRIEEHLMPPKVEAITKDGLLEMADFKPEEFKCRLRPTLEPPVNCTFEPDRANEVQSALRHPVRITGRASVSAQTGKLESVHIERIEPLDSLELDAGSFFAHPSFDQLARQQAIKPLRDPGQLAGVFPADFDVEEMVEDIYRSRT